MHGRRARLSWLTKLVVGARHANETRLARFYRHTQEALDREIPRSEQIRLGWEIKRHESGNHRFYYVHIPVGVNCFVCAARDGIRGWRIVGHRTPNVPVMLTHSMNLIRNRRLMRAIAAIIACRPVYVDNGGINLGVFSETLFIQSYLYNK